MNTPLPDLGDLLHEAVDEIEPADRIAAIRERTANAPNRTARPWFYAASGVVLATAATVAAFAVIGSSPSADHHDPTASPTGTQVVPAYFTGRDALADRLFREFDTVPAGDPLQAALDRIQRPADDPDYGTTWPAGSLDTATVEDGVIEVELGDVDVDASAIAGQQLVYTLQAAVGERLPVQRLRDGEPVGAPMTAGPQTQVLNQVMVNDPTEGLAVHDRFTARGAANSFEANVPWELRDDRGEVVKEGHATAAGYGTHLYPWEAHVDVRGLPFGYYTFVATTDDPSNGEGGGPDSDTRTIIVR